MKKLILLVGSRLLTAARTAKIIGAKQLLKYWLARNNKPIRITIAGSRITVRKNTPDLTVALASLCGEFDSSKYLLPGDFEGVIVDAGGYIGTAAVAFSKMFPLAQIVTVEPSLSNLQVLQQNVQSLPNIRAVHGALVGISRPSVVLHDPGLNEWGFTTVDEHSSANHSNALYEVPAFSISELGFAVSEVGLLKLDIEGGEHEILTHGRSEINAIDVVIVELHERFVPGCEAAFFEFSKNRIVFKDTGEKFISVRRGS
jgi:FkbM family methyltransferase